jgi:ribosomal protein S18 acetylase RimI-like enzyme
MKIPVFNNGIKLRPATQNDEVFIANLFRSTRQTILMADAERGYLEMIVEQQQELQIKGYEINYPNAFVFIAEFQQEKIGRVIVDFGSNVANLIDIMFILQARNKGYGRSIIQALQQAAQKNVIPMTLVVDQENTSAKHLYLSLGFKTESIKPPSELMVWYPQTQKIMA